jgi:hypothetical protein
VTALADITKALASMPPVEPGKCRFVVVGPSAARALACDCDRSVPNKLTRKDAAGRVVEEFPIVATQAEDHPGWSIVDRPPHKGRLF